MNFETVAALKMVGSILRNASTPDRSAKRKVFSKLMNLTQFQIWQKRM